MRSISETEKYERTVLVCPLDWGLGHASRCVPLIRMLDREGTRVILAASGRAAAFLRSRFPELPCLDFPDYRIRIPQSGNLLSYLILRLPVYFMRICREHRQLKRMIRQYGISYVISDNRYGLWSRKAHTVFITHQLMLKLPSGLRFWEGRVHRMILRFVGKFDECWIPDGNPPLSGDLSHKYPLPDHARLAGHMSRFNHPETNANSDPCDFLAILSGPEPQRSYFEKMVLQWFLQSGKRCIILRGVPGSNEKRTEGMVEIRDHADDLQFAALVRNAGTILCRGGYTTLCDLAALGRTAILIPTPGQTEQEYLAAHLKAHWNFVVISQEIFALRGLEAFPNHPEKSPEDVLPFQAFRIPDSSPLAVKL